MGTGSHHQGADLYSTGSSMNLKSYQYILDGREKRSALIQKSLARHPMTHIEVSLNIPGEKKDSPLLRAVHLELLNRLLPLTESSLVFLEYAPDGPFALLRCEKDAEEIKAVTADLEDGTPIGRLYDIDVFPPNGIKLSRSAGARSCFLCREPAVVCAREERHTKEKIAENISQRIRFSAPYVKILSLETSLADDRFHAIPFSLEDDRASVISRLAQKALTEEVLLTPKPGLVDREDNGSHHDMDLQTFLSSASALGRTFYEIAHRSGCEKGEAHATLFPSLREIGKEGERAMFRATGGVNTHKGMIFSCGLLSSAAVLCDSVEEMPSVLRSLCSGIVEEDLGTLEKGITYGEKLYLETQSTGIRGEAEQGFPVIFSSYERFKELLKVYGRDESLIQVLMEIMSTFEDTNILGRGGAEALSWVHEEAGTYLEAGGALNDAEFSRLRDVNEKFKERNLSPGGCADTIGCIIFLHLLESEGVLKSSGR